MRKFTLATTFMVTVLSVASLLPPITAHAIEYGGFGGKPAFPREDNPRTQSIFVHTMEPGTSVQEGVLVINNSPEPKTILVYAADSTPSTDGAFACKQLAEDQTEVGSWIALEKSEVTLAPNTNEVVKFVINVPQTAGVGEHNGCVLTQEKKAKPEGQSGASLSIRTGLRVAITVPGELERKLEIAGFVSESKDGGFSFKPSVKNVGNVSIDANVHVKTSYFFGLPLTEFGGQYPILRGDTSNWNFEMKKPFWGGWYKAVMSVDYDANKEATVGVNSDKGLTTIVGPTIAFFSFPAVGALAIELLVLAVILFGLFRVYKMQKQARWIKTSWISKTVKSGDDIKSVADEAHISWKLLAKANKLKAPYALKAGEKIKVPPTK